MDSNTLLSMLRELSQRVIEEESGDAGDLAEAIQNMDEWLSKGGFLPEEWNKHERC